MFSRKSLLGSVLAMAVASLMIFTTGCEDDKDTPTGTSVVRGEVAAVSTEFVPGIVSGITVHLVGPVTLKTISDENGIFEFTNVPAGDFVLIFFVNGGQATKEITIGEGETILFAHVSVNANGEVVITTDKKKASAPAPVEPAIINIAGSWTLTYNSPLQDMITTITYSLVLEQNETIISGTLEYSESNYNYMVPTLNVSGTLIGTALELTVNNIPARDSIAITSLSGTVNAEGTEMSGTLTLGGGGTATWTASPTVVNR